MLRTCSLMLGMTVLVLPVTAWAGAASDAEVPASFSLTQIAQDSMSETTTTTMSSSSWDIEGPVSMRGADVQETGTFDLKMILDYSTASDGTDDDLMTRFEFQWGLMEDHELTLKLPINYGDGEDGNVDLHVGWQWKLCDGSDWMPAMALYNELRLPTGNNSDGVDWEGRLIASWMLSPDSLRLHLNPFIRVIDTDDDDDDDGFFFGDADGDDDGERDFAAGGIIGIDYRLSDTAILNLDYILDSGTRNGHNMEHSMEVGLDYQLAANQTLGWSTRFTLDGDDQGDNWGMAISYMIALDGPQVGWGEGTFKYPKLDW